MGVGDVVANISKLSGKGIYFDNVNSGVTFSSPSILDHTTISFSVWVKLDGAQDNGDVLLTLKNTASGNAYKLSLWAGVVYWSINNEAGNKASIALSSDVWHHIACTFDGRTLRLYLNGALVSSAQNTGTPWSIDTMYYGNSAGGNWLKGTLDDIRFYAHILTDAEVTALAKGTYPAKKMLTYTSFNDTSDQGHDDSGNGNNGTLVGGATSAGGHNTVEDDLNTMRATENDKWGFIPLANDKEIMTINVEEA